METALSRSLEAAANAPPPPVPVDVKALRLEEVLKTKGNKTCADCPTKKPLWASYLRWRKNEDVEDGVDGTNDGFYQDKDNYTATTTNNGDGEDNEKDVNIEGCLAVLVCNECAQHHHFELGKKRCLIKYLKFSHEVTSGDIDILEHSGNYLVNKYYEAHLTQDDFDKDLVDEDAEEEGERRAKFIKKKYKKVKFRDHAALAKAVAKLQRKRQIRELILGETAAPVAPAPPEPEPEKEEPKPEEEEEAKPEEEEPQDEPKELLDNSFMGVLKRAKSANTPPPALSASDRRKNALGSATSAPSLRPAPIFHRARTATGARPRVTGATPRRTRSGGLENNRSEAAALPSTLFAENNLNGLAKKGTPASRRRSSFGDTPIPANFGDFGNDDDDDDDDKEEEVVAALPPPKKKLAEWVPPSKARKAMRRTSSLGDLKASLNGTKLFESSVRNPKKEVAPPEVLAPLEEPQKELPQKTSSKRAMRRPSSLGDLKGSLLGAQKMDLAALAAKPTNGKHSFMMNIGLTLEEEEEDVVESDINKDKDNNQNKNGKKLRRPSSFSGLSSLMQKSLNSRTTGMEDKLSKLGNAKSFAPPNFSRGAQSVGGSTKSAPDERMLLSKKNSNSIARSNSASPNRKRSKSPKEEDGENSNGKMEESKEHAHKEDNDNNERIGCSRSGSIDPQLIEQLGQSSRLSRRGTKERTSRSKEPKEEENGRSSRRSRSKAPKEEGEGRSSRRSRSKAPKEDDGKSRSRSRSNAPKDGERSSRRSRSKAPKEDGKERSRHDRSESRRRKASKEEVEKSPMRRSKTLDDYGIHSPAKRDSGGTMMSLPANLALSRSMTDDHSGRVRELESAARSRDKSSDISRKLKFPTRNRDSSVDSSHSRSSRSSKSSSRLSKSSSKLPGVPKSMLSRSRSDASADSQISKDSTSSRSSRHSKSSSRLSKSSSKLPDVPRSMLGRSRSRSDESAISKDSKSSRHSRSRSQAPKEDKSSDKKDASEGHTRKPRRSSSFGDLLKLDDKKRDKKKKHQSRLHKSSILDM